ncbi:MAG TPA: endonuclease III [Mesorhizobium sp.]|jgi:endonuclease-3|nr:endonuclease III [Mesorhizobium sp.]
MRKPKSQTVAAEDSSREPPSNKTAPPPPGRRDGQNVKPRPRPQRPALLRAAQAAATGAPAYAPAEVGEIFRRLKVQRPEPKGELVSVNPFTLLVAVALSAQATDKSVNQATEKLFEVADTPRKMLALGEERLGEHIRTIGLWRAKAKNVIALSEALIRDHGGQVPADMEALVKLPGVGRKTANVVLNTAFGQSTLAVDTHIFRIGNRLGLGPGKTPDQVEAALLKVIPQEYRKGAHHWLLLHGRYVCKARRPECERCVIADLCKAAEKTNSVPAPLEPIP